MQVKSITGKCFLAEEARGGWSKSSKQSYKSLVAWFLKLAEDNV